MIKQYLNHYQHASIRDYVAIFMLEIDSDEVYTQWYKASGSKQVEHLITILKQTCKEAWPSEIDGVRSLTHIVDAEDIAIDHLGLRERIANALGDKCCVRDYEPSMPRDLSDYPWPFFACLPFRVTEGTPLTPSAAEYWSQAQAYDIDGTPARLLGSYPMQRVKDVWPTLCGVADAIRRHRAGVKIKGGLCPVYQLTATKPATFIMPYYTWDRWAKSGGAVSQYGDYLQEYRSYCGKAPRNTRFIEGPIHKPHPRKTGSAIMSLADMAMSAQLRDYYSVNSEGHYGLHLRGAVVTATTLHYLTTGTRKAFIQATVNAYRNDGERIASMSYSPVTEIGVRMIEELVDSHRLNEYFESRIFEQEVPAYCPSCSMLIGFDWRGRLEQCSVCRVAAIRPYTATRAA